MEKCFQCGQIKKEGKRMPYYEKERPPVSVFICSDCLIGPIETYKEEESISVKIK